MNNLKRYVVGAVVLILLGGAAVWVYRHFSPFHVCVRHYSLEAMDRGESPEAAKAYATGLCTRKNPLRN